jgi:anthranilate phosphoribosyltransferase
MSINTALTEVVEGRNLDVETMRSTMHEIMSGNATNAQIAAFLVALRMKGETLDEITGAVEVMRELAKSVHVFGDYLVDIVGTGGDKSHLFNVSTASTFVVAAAGGRVAKHGNRSVSSKSGSADLLEEAGVNLNLNVTEVAECVEKIGVGFMFAPSHHSAMKYAIGPRKEIGLRTIFNILGPMTNPAGVKRQLIGVYDQDLCRPMAEVLGRLGAEHVLVVHSADGLDEISTAADTFVAEFKYGSISEYSISPENYVTRLDSNRELQVNDSRESLDLILKAFDGKAPYAVDIISLNAGAALYVAGRASSIKEGVYLATEQILSGAARVKLEELVLLSNSFQQK